MRPAELCAPERTSGAGVAHRSTFPKLVDETSVYNRGVSAANSGVIVVARAGDAVRDKFGVGPGQGGASHNDVTHYGGPRGAAAMCPPTGAETADTEVIGSARLGVYGPVKFAAEWVTALALLVLTAPLVALFAGLVKLTSPGPAFYLQTRLGRHGRTYLIRKLRTMEHNCEARTGPVWASKGDARITAIGRILRMTHLDELPQLWNVLRGEMSLIGPRPERPEIVARIEREVPDYRGRLQVRPGVTGLAQMCLPADTDIPGVRRKLAHDLYYIRRLTPILDLRIAVCTAFYFLGAAAEAVCTVAVGSYGKAAESPPAEKSRPEVVTHGHADLDDASMVAGAVSGTMSVAVNP